MRLITNDCKSVVFNPLIKMFERLKKTFFFSTTKKTWMGFGLGATIPIVDSESVLVSNQKIVMDTKSARSETVIACLD